MLAPNRMTTVLLERRTVWRYWAHGKFCTSLIYGPEKLGIEFHEGEFWRRETWICNHGPQAWARKIAARKIGGFPRG